MSRKAKKEFVRIDIECRAYARRGNELGSEHLPYELLWLIRLKRHVIAFEQWSGLKSSVLAFIIFAISAFSVPLLHEGQADAVQAVLASVRAVLGNFLPTIA